MAKQLELLKRRTSEFDRMMDTLESESDVPNPWSWSFIRVFDDCIQLEKVNAAGFRELAVLEKPSPRAFYSGLVNYYCICTHDGRGCKHVMGKDHYCAAITARTLDFKNQVCSQAKFPHQVI